MVFSDTEGKKICLVSTGYMTHKAIKAAGAFDREKIGVIDVFLLKPLNERLFVKVLRKYECVITLEEGFINKGGIDSLVSSVIDNSSPQYPIEKNGF